MPPISIGIGIGVSLIGFNPQLAIPENFTPPVISGLAAVGQTLSIMGGMWHNEVSSFAYSWERDGVAIPGATSETYVLVSDDLGTSITCSESATNEGGTSAAVTSESVTVLGFLFSGYGLPDGLFTADMNPADIDQDPVSLWVDKNDSAFDSPAPAILKYLADGSALRFNGSSQYYQRDNIVLTGDFTIFVKQATTGDSIIIGGNNLSGGANHQVLRMQGGGDARMSFFDGGTQVFSNPLSTARGIPNVVGLIRSGGVVTFYEGETPIGGGAAGGVVGAGCIGAVTISGTSYNFTNGDIYSVLIADTAMTANVAQIVAALS